MLLNDNFMVRGFIIKKRLEPVFYVLVVIACAMALNTAAIYSLNAYFDYCERKDIKALMVARNGGPRLSEDVRRRLEAASEHPMNSTVAGSGTDIRVGHGK